MKEKFINNGIEYIRCGDYYIPNLELPENKYEIGKPKSKYKLVKVVQRIR